MSQSQELHNEGSMSSASAGDNQSVWDHRNLNSSSNDPFYDAFHNIDNDGDHNIQDSMNVAIGKEQTLAVGDASADAGISSGNGSTAAHEYYDEYQSKNIETTELQYQQTHEYQEGLRSKFSTSDHVTGHLSPADQILGEAVSENEGSDSYAYRQSRAYIESSEISSVQHVSVSGDEVKSTAENATVEQQQEIGEFGDSSTTGNREYGGWVEYMTEDGYIYYYNAELDQSTWERPIDFDARDAQSASGLNDWNTSNNSASSNNNHDDNNDDNTNAVGDGFDRGDVASIVELSNDRMDAAAAAAAAGGGGGGGLNGGANAMSEFHAVEDAMSADDYLVPVRQGVMNNHDAIDEYYQYITQQQLEDSTTTGSVHQKDIRNEPRDVSSLTVAAAVPRSGSTALDSSAPAPTPAPAANRELAGQDPGENSLNGSTTMSKREAAKLLRIAVPPPSPPPSSSSSSSSAEYIVAAGALETIAVDAPGGGGIGVDGKSSPSVATVASTSSTGTIGAIEINLVEQNRASATAAVEGTSPLLSLEDCLLQGNMAELRRWTTISATESPAAAAAAAATLQVQAAMNNAAVADSVASSSPTSASSTLLFHHLCWSSRFNSLSTQAIYEAFGILLSLLLQTADQPRISSGGAEAPSLGSLWLDSVDAHGNTLLHACAAAGNDQILHCLLTMGLVSPAQVERQASMMNRDGDTALQVAAKANQLTCLQLLVLRSRSIQQLQPPQQQQQQQQQHTPWPLTAENSAGPSGRVGPALGLEAPVRLPVHPAAVSAVSAANTERGGGAGAMEENAVGPQLAPAGGLSSIGVFSAPPAVTTATATTGGSSVVQVPVVGAYSSSAPLPPIPTGRSGMSSFFMSPGSSAEGEEFQFSSTSNDTSSHPSLSIPPQQQQQQQQDDDDDDDANADSVTQSSSERALKSNITDVLSIQQEQVVSHASAAYGYRDSFSQLEDVVDPSTAAGISFAQSAPTAAAAPTAAPTAAAAAPTAAFTAAAPAAAASTSITGIIVPGGDCAAAEATGLHGVGSVAPPPLAMSANYPPQPPTNVADLISDDSSAGEGEEGEDEDDEEEEEEEEEEGERISPVMKHLRRRRRKQIAEPGGGGETEGSAVTNAAATMGLEPPPPSSAFWSEEEGVEISADAAGTTTATTAGAAAAGATTATSTTAGTGAGGEGGVGANHQYTDPPSFNDTSIPRPDEEIEDVRAELDAHEVAWMMYEQSRDAGTLEHTTHYPEYTNNGDNDMNNNVHPNYDEYHADAAYNYDGADTAVSQGFQGFGSALHNDLLKNSDASTATPLGRKLGSVGSGKQVRKATLQQRQRTSAAAGSLINTSSGGDAGYFEEEFYEANAAAGTGASIGGDNRDDAYFAWTECVTAQGDVYYYNPVTQHVQWESPYEEAQEEEEQPQQQQPEQEQANHYPHHDSNVEYGSESSNYDYAEEYNHYYDNDNTWNNDNPSLSNSIGAYDATTATQAAEHFNHYSYNYNHENEHGYEEEASPPSYEELTGPPPPPDVAMAAVVVRQEEEVVPVVSAAATAQQQQVPVGGPRSTVPTTNAALAPGGGGGGGGMKTHTTLSSAGGQYAYTRNHSSSSSSNMVYNQAPQVTAPTTRHAHAQQVLSSSSSSSAAAAGGGGGAISQSDYHYPPPPTLSAAAASATNGNNSSSLPLPELQPQPRQEDSNDIDDVIASPPPPPPPIINQQQKEVYPPVSISYPGSLGPPQVEDEYYHRNDSSAAHRSYQYHNDKSNADIIYYEGDDDAADIGAGSGVNSGGGGAESTVGSQLLNLAATSQQPQQSRSKFRFQQHWNNYNSNNSSGGGGGGGGRASTRSISSLSDNESSEYGGGGAHSSSYPQLPPYTQQQQQQQHTSSDTAYTTNGAGGADFPDPHPPQSSNDGGGITTALQEAVPIGKRSGKEGLSAAGEGGGGGSGAASAAADGMSVGSSAGENNTQRHLEIWDRFFRNAFLVNQQLQQEQEDEQEVGRGEGLDGRGRRGAGMDMSRMSQASVDESVRRVRQHAAQSRSKGATAAARWPPQLSARKFSALMKLALRSGNFGGEDDDDNDEDEASFLGGAGPAGGSSRSVTSIDGTLLSMAMLAAALHDNVEKMEQLLRCGANPSCVDDQIRSPAHYASRNGHASSLALLFDHGADLEATDAAGRTPLHVAVIFSRVDAVDFLLGCAVDCNVADLAGNTPLHLAARAGFETGCQQLLAFGALPLVRNLMGLTAAGVAEVMRPQTAALAAVIKLLSTPAASSPERQYGQLPRLSVQDGGGRDDENDGEAATRHQKAAALVRAAAAANASIVGAATGAGSGDNPNTTTTTSASVAVTPPLRVVADQRLASNNNSSYDRSTPNSHSNSHAASQGDVPSTARSVVRNSVVQPEDANGGGVGDGVGNRDEEEEEEDAEDEEEDDEEDSGDEDEDEEGNSVADLVASSVWGVAASLIDVTLSMFSAPPPASARKNKKASSRAASSASSSSSSSMMAGRSAAGPPPTDNELFAQGFGYAVAPPPHYSHPAAATATASTTNSTAGSMNAAVNTTGAGSNTSSSSSSSSSLSLMETPTRPAFGINTAGTGAGGAMSTPAPPSDVIVAVAMSKSRQSRAELWKQQAAAAVAAEKNGNNRGSRKSSSKGSAHEPPAPLALPHQAAAPASANSTTRQKLPKSRSGYQPSSSSQSLLHPSTVSASADGIDAVPPPGHSQESMSSQSDAGESASLSTKVTPSVAMNSRNGYSLGASLPKGVSWRYVDIMNDSNQDT